MDISLSYPSWLVILCVLLGVVYSVLFYRKEKSLDGTPQWLMYVMALTRFSVVTILALLLLEPLIQSENQKIEKPIIVIAQDNSESILLNKDSAYYLSDYQSNISNLVSELSTDYEVKTVSFGDELVDGLDFSFEDKQTDFSTLLDDLYAKYYGRNLGAVIIASDGVYNKGQNPLYASNNLSNTSFYSIALGDTNKKKDVAIANVAHNKLAYLGNDFPVEVVISADYYKGNNSTVAILKNGTVISSQEVNFNSDNEVVTLPFQIEAKKAGKQIYKVQVSPLDEEFTTVNNSQDIFIEVLDNKQKILIVSAAPHPDISALKNAIEKNINYEVSVTNVMDYSGKLEEFSLVILHQVPSVNGGENKLMSDIAQSKIPALFFLGGQMQYSAFNNLKLGLSIIGPNGVTDAKPSLNTTFNNFTVENNLKSLFPELPPMQIPFASDYKLSNGAQVLLNQKIGNTATTFPLIAFNTKNDQKFGFVLGEGIWRWKFQDFIKNNSTVGFESIVSKMVQFLAVKEDKSKFRVSSESEFLENEHVVFQAELYNDIYELVNDTEVVLEIENADGETLPIKSFSKAGKSYRLDAGVFAPGKYQYTARTTFDGKKYEVSGTFVINELKVEYLNAVADHSLLYNLSEKTGGKMYGKDDFAGIKEHIKNNNNIASVSYVNKEMTDVIKWKWILILILILLSLEWFLRKRNGAY